MASKNLTRKYVDIRNGHKANRTLQVYSSDEGDEESATRTLLSRDRDSDSSGRSRDEAQEWQASLRSNLPPIWVDLIDQMEENVSEIQTNMRALSRLHAARLMVDFDSDETAQERDIDKMTKSITSVFRRAESVLKRFTSLENDPSVSAAETAVRRNMKRNIAKKLQGLSAAFRQSQKDYLKRMSAQKAGCRFNDAGLDFLTGGVPTAVTEGDGPARFTDQQLAELEDQEALVNQRDAEITRIAQSIEELASIFKELAVLVIDQGTLLDRIDYNMEQVVDHTREGISQLTIAEEHQKSARGLKCVVCLVVSNAVAAFVLYMHWRREWRG